MSDNTSIEWTEATWNPIRARRKDGQPNKGGGWHCERVSPGCQHCYAERLNEKRFGTGLPYNRKSRDLVDIYLDEKALTQPLHWRRRPRKIFVCSMTDLFGEWVPDEVIDLVFTVMALSPQHTFQVLTKRPERMREYLTNADRLYVLRSSIEEWLTEDDCRLRWPLRNVQCGVSVEDQERADKRIPELLGTPAAVRFLSCEPLLGPIKISGVCSCGTNYQTGPLIHGDRHHHELHWVIVGGESGPGARPCDEDWIRGIVQQCQSVRVPVFVKQGSGPRPGMPTGDPELDGLKEYPNGHA